jgi:imidazolonepropionase-like amidohydrolase
VASGKSADFLVLDANPLDSIANTRRISRVYMRGVEVDRAALRTQLINRSAETRAPTTH